MLTDAMAQATMTLPDAIEHARAKGPVRVQLTPESAAPILQTMHRTGLAVFAEVRPIADLKEPGCKRIEVRLTAPGSKLELKAGGTADLDQSMQLNVCEKGRPGGR